MALTAVIEMLVIWLLHTHESYNSTPIYVIGMSIGFFSLVVFYFYKILEDPFLKRVQLAFIILNFLNYRVSIFFNEDFLVIFPIYTFFSSIILLIFSVALFLYELFNTEKILNLKSYYPFWIAISLLMIYLGILPIMIMSNTFGTQLNPLIFRSLLVAINFIGYSVMLGGIFYSRNQQKKLEFGK